MLRIVSLLLCLLLLAAPAMADYPYDRYGWRDDISYKQPGEIKGNIDLIHSRHAGRWFIAYRLLNGLGMPQGELAPSSYSYKTSVSGSDWVKRVSSIRGVELPEGLEEKLKYSYGCNFDFSTKLLNERIEALGREHPYVQHWVNQQNRVYANCNSHTDKAVLPWQFKTDAEGKLGQMAEEDFAYQLASAYFYHGDYQQAADTYAELALNSKYYHHSAAYMQARSYVNGKMPAKAYPAIQAILADPSQKPIHQDARDLMGTMAFNTENADYWAEQLRQILQPMLIPADTPKRREFLRRQLLQQNYDLWFFLGYHGVDTDAVRRVRHDSDLLDWLVSFTMPYYDLHEHWGSDIVPPTCNSKLWECEQAEQNYQAFREIRDYSIEQWKRRKQLHWLLAAAMRTGSRDYFADTVMEEFSSIRTRMEQGQATDAEQYAYPTLFYHAVRLMARHGKMDEAATLVQQALSHEREYAPRTAYRLAQYEIAIGQRDAAIPIIDAALQQSASLESEEPFSLLKMSYVRSVAQLVELGQTLGTHGEAEYWQKQAKPDAAHFYVPVTRMLDLLTVDDLLEVAELPILSRAAKNELLQVSFVRAVMLHRYTLAGKLARRIGKRVPKLKDYMDVYLNAPQGSKAKAATYILLRNPRLSIYLTESDYTPDYTEADRRQFSSYERIDLANPKDGNWWCAYDAQGALNKAISTLYDQVVLDGLRMDNRDAGRNALYAKMQQAKTQFVSAFPLLRQLNNAEQVKLEAAGHGTLWLQKKAVRWAAGRNWLERWLSPDPLIAPTLNRAVLVSRYGCNATTTRPETGEYSHRAFELLHDHYGDSEWAQKTPYWFNSRGD